MKRQKLLLVMVNAISIALLLVVALDVPNARGQSSKPIEVGMTTDMSGPTANNGLLESNAVKVYIDQVNKAGGIKGRPVNFRVTDNGADPTKIIGQLKMFKDRDNCVLVNAGTTTTVVSAAKTWGEQNKIAVVSSSAMSDILDTKGTKSWLFRTNCPNSGVIRAALLSMKNKGYKKVGLISTTLTWGTDALATMKEYAPQYGLQFAGYELLEVKSKDAAIQVRKLKGTGVEALLNLDYAAENGVWARGFKQVGWSPYIVSYDAEIGMSLTMYPAELFEGWDVVGLFNPKKPLLAEFWNQYEKFTGKRSETSQTARAADGGRIMMEALKLADNPDNPESIRDAFYKINIPLVLGREGAMVNFEIGRNYTLKPEDLLIITIKNGKFVYPK